MRRLSRNKPGTEVEYTPAAYGNREDPEPCVVTYRVPTPQEKRRLAGFWSQFLKNTLAKQGVELPSIDEAFDRYVEATLTELVVKVSDYEGPCGPITNGEKLNTYGDDLLVLEVYDEILQSASLTEDEEKKSQPSPDSDSLATQHSGETATNA